MVLKKFIPIPPYFNLQTKGDNMHKLIDIKIGTQLILGFSIIMIFIAIIGYVSWLHTNQIADKTTDLYNHPLMVRRALGEFKSDILYIDREIQKMHLYKDDSDIVKSVQTIEVYKINGFNQLKVLQDRYLGPNKDVDMTNKSYIKWVKVQDETIRLFLEKNSNKQEIHQKLSVESDQLLDILIEHIQQIDVFAKNKGDSFYFSVINLNDMLNRQLYIYIFIVLIVMFLIVNIINKNIRKPLLELTQVSQQFRQGNLNVRSKYTLKNEFGILSLSFNEFIETLQKDLLINSKVSKITEVMLSEDEAHAFCHNLLTNLIVQTESQMVSIFLLNSEKKIFEKFESIGMNNESNKSFSATDFEGEFGAVLASREIQYIQTIPEDSQFSFHTVSGIFRPKEIITIPIILSNEVFAIISLASISVFKEINIRFIKAIESTLNARIGGVFAYRKTLILSKQLEHQNLELESQKNQLSLQSNELMEQNIELELQKKQLDEANRLKTVFLSNMSHELRTPLNSVIALSGVLSRRIVGKIPDEEYNYLEVIERNGKQLLSLINDILDLSRIESGRDDIEISSFNLNDIIEEIIEMLETLANEKGVRLIYEIDSNLPNIISDYEKTKHILQNIIANSVKFTEEGKIEIITKVKNDNIMIEIFDTGIGIDNKYLTDIFSEFRQADSSNTKKYGGSGLGLAIAKKYADLLNAEIKVESEIGKGSVFSIMIPINYANKEYCDEELPEYYHSNKKIIHKSVKENEIKTLLLVEDSESIIIQMKDILSAEGYQIQIAHNGNEALDLISKRIPDGMILDLMMPNIDGFEVLKRIRDEEITSKLPVIILTAKFVNKEELTFLKHNHINQLIRKGDINKKQLLNVVSEMLFSDDIKNDNNINNNIKQSDQNIPKLFILDEDQDSLLTMKALLSQKYLIFASENCEDIIEIVRKQNPQIIIMNIGLNRNHCINCLQQLKTNYQLQKIPVIAISASAMKGDKEKFITEGFDDFISKPIDFKILLPTIERLIYGDK